MGQPPRRKKSKLLMLIAAAVIAVLVTSVILYRLYVGPSTSPDIIDPTNDEVLSLGTLYPGMMDVVSAALRVNGTALTVTVEGRAPVSVLGDGEYGQWNITLILENDTDVLKTYVVCVSMNSTQLTGSVVDVGAGTVKTCQVEYKNSLTVVAGMSELNRTKVIFWNVLATYVSYSGDQLVTSASDMDPDQGLQQTILGT